MDEVDLGFVEKCEPWQLESRLFPSKVGGKPAWLTLENLPKSEDLCCNNCKKPLTFLCQIYAPIEDDEKNFHRTLFMFVCRSQSCCIRNSSDNIKVFRNSLPQENKFYSNSPPEEKPDPNFTLSKWLKLCHVCGNPAEKTCSKCKNVPYCSRDHQVIDWKVNHKSTCGTENPTSERQKHNCLFDEFELVMEQELFDKNKSVVNENEEMEKYRKLQSEGKVGTMLDVPEDELETHANKLEDKVFSKFRERVRANPDQVLRYHKGKKPLWVAESPVPENIPKCENCESDRQFEFQIMPQLLSILKENELDWGAIAVYSCNKNCVDGSTYKREFVFKQDVSLQDNM